MAIADQDKNDYEAICQNLNDKLERIEKETGSYPSQLATLQKKLNSGELIQQQQANEIDRAFQEIISLQS